MCGLSFPLSQNVILLYFLLLGRMPDGVRGVRGVGTGTYSWSSDAKTGGSSAPDLSWPLVTETEEMELQIKGAYCI